MNSPAVIDSFQGDYRFLSNFHLSPITVRVGKVDIQASTVEHAYQALKATSAGDRIKVLSARTPGGAKRLGKEVTVRSDWEKVKKRIMRDLVLAKFTQNPKLGALLLETGEAELVEGNWWGDRYWGVCRGVGENHLGRILMWVRATLRRKRRAALEEMVRHDEELGLYDESVGGGVAAEGEGESSEENALMETEVTTPRASSDDSAPQSGPWSVLDRWIQETSFFSFPWQWIADTRWRDVCLLPGVEEEVISRMEAGDVHPQFFTLLAAKCNYDPIREHGEREGGFVKFSVAEMAQRWVKWYRNRADPAYWEELERERDGSHQSATAEEGS